MTTMGEHMLNALIQGLNELKQEYNENPGKLTYKIILKNVYSIIAKYTIDRKYILYMLGALDLTLNEFQALKELDYED